MLIIDAHLDIAWNALQGNRDLRLSAYTIRAQEHGLIGPGRALGTVALPELRRGHIALCFATVLARHTGIPSPGADYPSLAQAYAAGQGHLAYYRALETEGLIRIIENLQVLNRHLAEWEAWEAESGDETAAPPIGFVISMESADPIMHPVQLEEWYAAGLRIIGPAHYGPGRYAGGTGTENGLSAIGVQLLKEMERLGVVLDLTHLSDQAFWQTLEAYPGPLLASHNNCRALVPHQRQFSNEQLGAIIERDGVIGVAFDNWMLVSGWVVGRKDNLQATLDRVVDHIDHICQLAGNAKHAALGTDLDGGFGREETPQELETIADLQKLVELLARRGYGPDAISDILHGNWLRLLRRVWR